MLCEWRFKLKSSTWSFQVMAWLDAMVFLRAASELSSRLLIGLWRRQTKIKKTEYLGCCCKGDYWHFCFISRRLGFQSLSIVYFQGVYKLCQCMHGFWVFFLFPHCKRLYRYLSGPSRRLWRVYNWPRIAIETKYRGSQRLDKSAGKTALKGLEMGSGWPCGEPQYIRKSNLGKQGKKRGVQAKAILWRLTTRGERRANKDRRTCGQTERQSADRCLHWR